MDPTQTESATGFLRRIGRSVFQGPLPPRDDRERAWFTFNTLLLHFRPTRLPAATLRLTHTFGLGGMSLVLVSILMTTGLFTMFVYEPSPERAYASIQSLESAVPFGRFVRAVHHWSANFLILVALLHLLRVFYTGGFRGKRQFNWIVGLSLLACILASNFTGYLLPWDQLSYWAVTICTGMLTYVPGIGSWLEQVARGGPEIGASTLVIFYALHTSVIPVLLVLLMAWHFWRVRKAGGVVVPREPSAPTSAKPERVLFLPHLFMRELAVGLSLIALVFLVALLFAAPLGAPGNPGMSPNPAKAPWYFLGLQELLLHLHPVVAVVVLPGSAVLALLLLPYVDSDSQLAGRWFLSDKGRRMAAWAAITALLCTPLWVGLDERFAGSSLATSFLGRGLLPLVFLLVALVGFYVLVKRLFRASRDESLQALFTLLFVGLVVLTCTGIWFRGAGMQLVWPWGR